MQDFITASLNKTDKTDKTDKTYKKSRKAVIDILTESMIDFGQSNQKDFDEFIEQYKPNGRKSFINVHYIKPQLNKEIFMSKETNLIIPDSLSYVRNPVHLNNICKQYDYSNTISKFVAKCVDQNSVPIGVLPWKLLRSSNILVEKESDYLDNIKEEIDNVINIIKEISKYENDDRIIKFGEFFPEHEIFQSYLESKKIPPYKQKIDILKNFI
jgi:hypothetical protein